MSRCFPFPPPGYERKARNDDRDLLEKEKHRDKKQRKEKKDKEKKEGKEKRDKDRSDGKHKEKKDKKEKHRDKDKDKDRDKDKDKKKDKEDNDKAKDKSKAPDEKRLSGQSDPRGGEKFGEKESREKNNSIDKKLPGQIGGHKVEKLIQNSNLVDDSKLVKDFGRRIKDDAVGTGNHVENISDVDRKKDEGMLRLVAKSTSTSAAIKEKDKRAEIKPTEEQGTRDGIRSGGNAMVQSTAGTIQNKFEGLPRFLDKNVERKLEGNEIPKDKENDDKRGIKTQEKDKENKSHGKDKDRDREKEDREKKKEDREKRKEDKQKKKEEKQRKKEDREKKKEEKEKEKEKEKTQLRNTELDKTRGSNQHDLIDGHAIKPPQLPKPTNSISPTDANPKKRKDYEINGVVHAQNVLPSKLPRPPALSSHPPLENGRILEHCQTSVLALDRKLASTNTKMDNKERKINGITEAQPPSVSPMKVKPTKPSINQTAKPVARLPHPDTKYLSQIYSVPKMEEWSDYDDQEWLFDGISSQPKKPKVDPSSSEEALQVWAEARQIESADIFALPYVIPY